MKFELNLKIIIFWIQFETNLTLRLKLDPNSNLNLISNYGDSIHGTNDSLDDMQVGTLHKPYIGNRQY